MSSKDHLVPGDLVTIEFSLGLFFARRIGSVRFDESLRTADNEIIMIINVKMRKYECDFTFSCCEGIYSTIIAKEFIRKI